MKASIEITGAAEWKAKLQAMGPAAFAAMVQSAHRSLEEVMTTSKEEYVPVDQGTLRSTGHVEPPSVSGASAEITMPATLDFTNYDAAATLVIGGLVIIWGVRKLIKLFNRS